MITKFDTGIRTKARSRKMPQWQGDLSIVADTGREKSIERISKIRSFSYLGGVKIQAENLYEALEIFKLFIENQDEAFRLYGGMA